MDSRENRCIVLNVFGGKWFSPYHPNKHHPYNYILRYIIYYIQMEDIEYK